MELMDILGHAFEWELRVNPHHGYCESIQEYLEQGRLASTEPRDIKETILSYGTIAELQVYPSTQVGFHYWAGCNVYHAMSRFNDWLNEPDNELLKKIREE